LWSGETPGGRARVKAGKTKVKAIILLRPVFHAVSDSELDSFFHNLPPPETKVNPFFAEFLKNDASTACIMPCVRRCGSGRLPLVCGTLARTQLPARVLGG